FEKDPIRRDEIRATSKLLAYGADQRPQRAIVALAIVGDRLGVLVDHRVDSLGDRGLVADLKETHRIGDRFGVAAVPPDLREDLLRGGAGDPAYFHHADDLRELVRADARSIDRDALSLDRLRGRAHHDFGDALPRSFVRERST